MNRDLYILAAVITFIVGVLFIFLSLSNQIKSVSKDVNKLSKQIEQRPVIEYHYYEQTHRKVK